MERVYEILRSIFLEAGKLGKVPKGVKFGMTAAGAAVGVFVLFGYGKFSQTEKTFFAILITLLGLIISGYYVWKGWNQKKQNQQFGGEISQHSSATPRTLSDPGQRARLDDLRKKFQGGVDAYKSRGKDLYKLPWYAIVGEPGSGKTEAVRHSNVGFPPGMQDEFQGVGGTINMNWWFTNHAVLLDTAGRLMFEDVKPGETSEWKEFLNLLKKNRPNCPVNGLFLVIPSDSLIKDSADAIQNKAGKIAQQLDVIQRVLDVRFPVFVIITKCDKINGFREFFDGLTDPQLQHQMMGWSNPDQLDEPFKPELVDKHLEQVAGRLRRRRLGLLRDPVPENTEGRRTDEVDSLYSLPHSLELLSSRLRRYLETIFIAGEWSAKPLFLRGIYFSSSMREGSALDQELAEAIGVSVDELPEGKIWERDRAYFLRDLFLEKVFKEKGLVTRATNTRRMLRGQQIALFTFGFLSLAVFCGFAWFAMGNLRGSVKDQSDYWRAVSAAGFDHKRWKQGLVPMRGDGSYTYSLLTNKIQVDKDTVTLGEFHQRLQVLAEKPLKRNFMFPTLSGTYNQNSRKAQRIVFESAVVAPLLDAARQRMTSDSPDSPAARFQPDALATLIRLEADLLTRGTSTNHPGTLAPDDARRFLSSLQDFVAGEETAVDTNLLSVMAWTYSTNATAKGTWPPRHLSGGHAGTNTLAVNTGIGAGLEYFIRSATNGIKSHLADWDQISALLNATKLFATYESALFSAAAGGVDAKFAEALAKVSEARKQLDALIKQAADQKVFAGGVSLTNAQNRFRATITGSAGAALGRIREINDTALAATKDYPLFKEIKTRLDSVQAALSNQVAQLLDSGDPREFQSLDDSCLTANAFANRADLYTKADDVLKEKPWAGKRLVGQKGEPLEKYLKEHIEPLRQEAATYAGRLKPEVTKTLDYQIKRAEKAQTDAFFTAYLAEAKASAGADLGFPLTRDVNWLMEPEKFAATGRQLKFVADDLPAFQKYSVRSRSKEWEQFLENVEGQQVVARALMSEDGLGICTVSLAAATDATRTKDAWRGTWRDLKLVCPGVNTETKRTESDTDLNLGDVPVQQKLTLNFYKNINDANPTPSPVATEAWGPVWLLHKYKGERDKADPRTWLVEFPATMPGASGNVRLKLKFERALPELDKWPGQ